MTYLLPGCLQKQLKASMHLFFPGTYINFCMRKEGINVKLKIFILFMIASILCLKKFQSLSSSVLSGETKKAFIDRAHVTWGSLMALEQFSEALMNLQ